jgi:cleavage and polyadenylation specificity factor subunit 1
MFTLLEAPSFSHLCEQTYVFEIVEVVPDPGSDIKRSFKLRLRCRDEAKGPVTAVCGIDGYLVSSMGQKVSVAHEAVEYIAYCRCRSLCVHLTSMSAWLAWRSLTLESM